MLDIPVGTIKSFCRRDEADEPAVTDYRAPQKLEITIENENPICPQCGTPVIRIPGRKKRVFCSEACRVAHWRTQAHADGKPALCAGCGKPLYGHDRRRKFCSHACYIHSRFGKQ